jgi:hypothetical protein
MLFGRNIAVYCENRTGHRYTAVTDAKFWYIYNSSFYLTGNTLRLCYRAQPFNAVWGNSRCLLYHTEPTDTLCGQFVPHRKHILPPNRLMLFGETVAVYCQSSTEHTDTLCLQMQSFLLFQHVALIVTTYFIDIDCIDEFLFVSGSTAHCLASAALFISCSTALFELLSLYSSAVLQPFVEPLSLYSSAVLQPFLGPWPLYSFIIRDSRYDFLDEGSARRRTTAYTQDSTNRIDTYKHQSWLRIKPTTADRGPKDS